jgi:competence protein ComEA
MGPSSDLFGAAWLVTAFLVLVAAWPFGGPSPDAAARAEACPAPRVLDSHARAGASPAVACDGAGGRELDGAGGRELDGALPLLFGGRIDLARADAAALEVLPRVGPALAAAIVAERERVPFCRLDDLERVRGIGPRTRVGLESWLEPGRDPRCARLSDRGGGP